MTPTHASIRRAVPAKLDELWFWRWLNIAFRLFLPRAAGRVDAEIPGGVLYEQSIL